MTNNDPQKRTPFTVNWPPVLLVGILGPLLLQLYKYVFQNVSLSEIFSVGNLSSMLLGYGVAMLIIFLVVKVFTRNQT